MYSIGDVQAKSELGLLTCRQQSWSTLLLRYWSWQAMLLVTTRRLALSPVTSSWLLSKLLGGVTIAAGGVLPNIHSVLLPKKTGKKGEE